jgi:hypothetical protein
MKNEAAAQQIELPLSETAAPMGSLWQLIEEWIFKSERLLIKRLSRNDCSWADDPRKHQSGLYIPAELRESEFFPRLMNVNPDKPNIYEARIKTLWPASKEEKESRLVHYSDKGAETHLTGVPKREFSNLSPASLFLAGSLEQNKTYWMMTIDSLSEESEVLESIFDIGSDFHYGIFDPGQVRALQRDETEELIYVIVRAMEEGRLAELLNRVSILPDPEFFAGKAQDLFTREVGVKDLNPFVLERPGDTVMRISRDIEYTIYKQEERRQRAVQVLNILREEGGLEGGAALIAAVVRGYAKLDRVFLSASQTRKSRAGYSFEIHIRRLLKDGKVPFDEQVIVGRRRPDFVLPGLKKLRAKTREREEALILSAKTTLRERWKQVLMERLNCSLFLATVDDRVSSEAIDEMLEHGMYLVVPESLKDSKFTDYGGKSNVISFRQFFDDEVEGRRQRYWQ